MATVAAQTTIFRQSLDGANFALGFGVMFMFNSSVELWDGTSLSLYPISP